MKPYVLSNRKSKNYTTELTKCYILIVGLDFWIILLAFAFLQNLFTPNSPNLRCTFSPKDILKHKSFFFMDLYFWYSIY